MADTMREKILFDTDIGSDIDDAVALSYLLAQPKCELMGITTVSGKAVDRARMASAMLHVAGRPDIPVYPGIEQPMLTRVRQPECPQASALAGYAHASDYPMGKVLPFMQDIIRSHPGEITLLAVGPMTNVGLLFAMDPELPALLRRVVLMCGTFRYMAFGTPLEWNAINDPFATAITYKARPPVHRSIGLDVTMQVQLGADQVRAAFARHDLLRLTAKFADVWFRHADIITFHDPLAAVSIFDEGVLTYERGTVEAEIVSERCMGLTHFKPEQAGPHEVAFGVDRARFFESYFAPFGIDAPL